MFAKDKSAFESYKNKSFIQVYMEHSILYVKDNNILYKVVSVDDIPITYNGAVECNIDNSLAAIAALYGLKVPLKMIARGLRTFENNEGRFNIIEKENYKVMLDYAHNIAGYEMVTKASRAFTHKRLIGIIGMPGDRENKDMQSVASACGSAFDRIYIKEDIDLRGRKEGETAGILKNYLASNNFPEQNIIICKNEIEALEKAMANAETGDFIVLLYEKLQPLLDLLASDTNKNQPFLPIPQNNDSTYSNYFG